MKGFIFIGLIIFLSACTTFTEPTLETKLPSFGIDDDARENSCTQICGPYCGSSNLKYRDSFIEEKQCVCQCD